MSDTSLFLVGVGVASMVMAAIGNIIFQIDRMAKRDAIVVDRDLATLLREQRKVDAQVAASEH